jgi:hypothetical protein
VTKGQEPRDHRLQLRVPKSLWLAIKRVAVEYERSPSDWIVHTLAEAIAKHDRKRRQRPSE